MFTSIYSETNFVKLGHELTNVDEEELVNFHIALQPKYPNMTYIRDCVTLRPPPNTASGTYDQRVRAD